MSSEGGGGGGQPKDNVTNSQRVGGGGSTAAVAQSRPANNNTTRRVLTSLAQQGYGAGLLSKFPEMGHNYEFMSSPSVRNEQKPRTRFTTSHGRTRMMHAADIGDMERLRDLVKKFNADIHIEDSVGLTALAWAAFRGKLRAVQFLVENGAEINRGKRGTTPLFCAVVGNHLTTVRWLCDRGANVNGDINVEGACRDNVSPQILEILCERGANLNVLGVHGTPLHAVANLERTGAKKAEILIRHNAPLEAEYVHQTPLLWAAEARNVGVVRALCENGANKEARDFSGMTPLMSACHSKISDGTVTALCEFGANKEARDPQGKTALFYALDTLNPHHTADVLRELLEQDVNIEARFGGKSVLDAAVETRIPEVVEMLCKQAKRKNIELNTPMAVRRVKKEIAIFKERLQDARDTHNRHIPRGNGNSNNEGEYARGGMLVYRQIVKDLEDILKILEKEPHQANGSKRATKKTAANSGGGGGGGHGSNSNWWRGGSKRKTRRFKN